MKRRERLAWDAFATFATHALMQALFSMIVIQTSGHQMAPFTDSGSCLHDSHVNSVQEEDLTFHSKCAVCILLFIPFLSLVSHSQKVVQHVRLVYKYIMQKANSKARRREKKKRAVQHTPTQHLQNCSRKSMKLQSSHSQLTRHILSSAYKTVTGSTYSYREVTATDQSQLAHGHRVATDSTWLQSGHSQHVATEQPQPAPSHSQHKATMQSQLAQSYTTSTKLQSSHSQHKATKQVQPIHIPWGHPWLCCDREPVVAPAENVGKPSPYCPGSTGSIPVHTQHLHSFLLAAVFHWNHTEHILALR